MEVIAKPKRTSGNDRDVLQYLIYECPPLIRNDVYLSSMSTVCGVQPTGYTVSLLSGNRMIV